MTQGSTRDHHRGTSVLRGTQLLLHLGCDTVVVLVIIRSNRFLFIRVTTTLRAGTSWHRFGQGIHGQIEISLLLG
jgi:hypothetical protein